MGSANIEFGTSGRPAITRPYLEALLEGGSSSAGSAFSKKQFQPPESYRAAGGPVTVETGGRYYPVRHPDAKGHKLTGVLLNFKDNKALPEKLVTAVAKIIVDKAFDLTHAHRVPVVLTSIPDKVSGDRQRRLLTGIGEEVERIAAGRIDTRADVFRWDGEAKKHALLKRKKERFENVVRHLHINDPDSCIDSLVIVLDDIVTSGATFWRAHKLLQDAGAPKSCLLALAHTVDDRKGRGL